MGVTHAHSAQIQAGRLNLAARLRCDLHHISHVAGLLNISWLIPGYQRDDTPPGGSLVFRLWQEEGRYRVETLYIAQTLKQMHEATPLSRDSGPAISPISIPGCSVKGAPYECDWNAFRQVMSNAIDPKYVRVP